MKRRSCTLQSGSGLKLPRHKVDQVVVQMGNDGTNDPVSLEVRTGQAMKHLVKSCLCRSARPAAH